MFCDGAHLTIISETDGKSNAREQWREMGENPQTEYEYISMVSCGVGMYSNVRRNTGLSKQQVLSCGA